MSRYRLLSIPLAFVALVVSCESVGSPPGFDSVPVIQSTTGSDQVGAPGAGVAVQWTTADCSVLGDTATDAGGVARASWTPAASASRRVSSATASISGSSADFTAFVVPAADEIVDITDTGFDPDLLTPPVGTMITWIWPSDASPHNVEPIGASAWPLRSGDPVPGPFL